MTRETAIGALPVYPRKTSGRRRAPADWFGGCDGTVRAAISRRALQSIWSQNEKFQASCRECLKSRYYPVAASG